MKQHLITGTLFLALIGSSSAILAQTITCAGHASYAVCAQGSAASWGRNFVGELGNGNNTNQSTPQQVGSLTDVVAIVGGNGYGFAQKQDGTVWAWGSNAYGGFGNGTNGYSTNVPQQVTALTGYHSFRLGAGHTLCLRNDSTLWSCGTNWDGELGIGSVALSADPVQVDSLTAVVSMAAGTHFSLAVRDDGTVWSWGRNDYGQLGVGSTTPSTVPVQITALTDVTVVETSYQHSLALRSDGTVWAWGRNQYGQLGDGTNTDSPVPVQVAGLTGITALATGWEHSLALKDDGTVWAWGSNGNGQFGDGGVGASNIPVQAGFQPGVVAITAGVQHSLAMMNDGMLWGCGANGAGQLGDGTTTERHSPVQVINLCELATATELPLIPGVMTATPNPTRGNVVIEWPGVGAQQVELRDALGQILIRSVFNGTRTEVDLTNQPSGIYFLSVHNGDHLAFRSLIKE